MRVIINDRIYLYVN